MWLQGLITSTCSTTSWDITTSIDGCNGWQYDGEVVYMRVMNTQLEGLDARSLEAVDQITRSGFYHGIEYTGRPLLHRFVAWPQDETYDNLEAKTVAYVMVDWPHLNHNSRQEAGSTLTIVVNPDEDPLGQAAQERAYNEVLATRLGRTAIGRKGYDFQLNQIWRGDPVTSLSETKPSAVVGECSGFAAPTGIIVATESLARTPDSPPSNRLTFYYPFKLPGSRALKRMKRAAGRGRSLQSATVDKDEFSLVGS